MFGVAFVALNVIAVFSLPLFAVTHQGSHYTENLFQQLSPSMAILHAGFPILSAVLMMPRRLGINRIGLVCFWLYCIAGSWTVGLFYLPSAVLLSWIYYRRSIARHGISFA